MSRSAEIFTNKPVSKIVDAWHRSGTGKCCGLLSLWSLCSCRPFTAELMACKRCKKVAYQLSPMVPFQSEPFQSLGLLCTLLGGILMESL